MKREGKRMAGTFGILLGFLCSTLPLRSAETNAANPKGTDSIPSPPSGERARERSSPSLVDFAQVQALFDKHCIECHESKDPEAKLVLESFESLMQGGE